MSDGVGNSVVALATPEFSIKRILRPFKGFEDVYQGVSSNRPICFCERNQPYDPIAKRGTTGYDPNLVYGVPGNMGTRCSIEFPMVYWKTPTENFLRYKFALSWRLRNTRDHNTNPDQRVPYHIAKSGAGVPETLPPNPGPRVPIYGIRESAVYAQTEPTTVYGESEAVVRPVIIEPAYDALQAPIMPDGSRGVIQQGIRPSDVGGRHVAPYFVNYETQAIGDDLVLCVFRDNPEGAEDWDFAEAGADGQFSLIFGKGDGVEYEDLGVLLSWGVSP